MSAEVGFEGLTYAGQEKQVVYERFLDVDVDLRAEIELRLVEGGMDSLESKVALDNSLIFLRAIAENPGIQLTPSEKVDEAWHSLILFTKDYAAYCEKVAGRFIHHNPHKKTSPAERSDLGKNQTFNFLVDYGYEPDDFVWSDGGASCGRCDGGCDGGGGGGGGSCDGGCDGV